MDYEILAWSENTLSHSPYRWVAVPPTTNLATLNYNKEPHTREVKIRALDTIWEVVIADWGFNFKGTYRVGQRVTNAYVRVDHETGKADAKNAYNTNLTTLQDAKMRAGLEAVASGMRILLAPYITYAKAAAKVARVRQLEAEADRLKDEFDQKVEEIWQIKRQLES